jgi:hypothetical protein
MLLGPLIEVKAIEGDALDTDRYLGHQRAYLGIEPIAVHAKVARRIAQPDQAGQQHRGGPVPIERPGPEQDGEGKKS